MVDFTQFAADGGAPQLGGPPVQQDLGPQQGGEEGVTAEEQERYSNIVDAGMTVLFKNPESRDAIVQMLKDRKENPGEALAETAMTLLKQMDGQAQASQGDNLPEEMILPVAEELIEQIGEIANAAGIFPVDQNVYGQAAQHFVILAADEYGMEPADAEDLLGTVDEAAQESIRVEQDGYWKGTPINQGGT